MNVNKLRYDNMSNMLIAEAKHINTHIQNISPMDYATLSTQTKNCQNALFTYYCTFVKKCFGFTDANVYLHSPANK